MIIENDWFLSNVSTVIFYPHHHRSFRRWSHFLQFLYLLTVVVLIKRVACKILNNLSLSFGQVTRPRAPYLSRQLLWGEFRSSVFITAYRRPVAASLGWSATVVGWSNILIAPRLSIQDRTIWSSPLYVLNLSLVPTRLVV